MDDHIYKCLYSFYIKQEDKIEDYMDLSAFLNILKTMTADDIYEIITENKNDLSKVSTSGIPQFSSKYDTYRTTRIIHDSGSVSMTPFELGQYLRGRGQSKESLRKYGENHYNFATQLGLAIKKIPLELTVLGNRFSSFSDKDCDFYIGRLCMRIPIIQHILLEAENGSVVITDYLAKFLSPVTAKRRHSNALVCFTEIKNISKQRLLELQSHLIW